MSGRQHFWRTVRLVTRWEFTSTVARAGFIAVLVILPLAHLTLAAVLAFALRGATNAETLELPIAVVDRHHVLRNVEKDGDLVLRNSEEALRRMSDGKLAAVYVLDDDYPRSGRVRAYSVPKGGFLQFGQRLDRRQRAATLIRSGLVDGDTDAARRLVEPITTLDAYSVTGPDISEESPFALMSVLGGPFGVCFVLGLAIFMTSGLLQESMSAELQNRMLEVLLPLLTPGALLTGKVIGLSAAGLLQLAVYLPVAALAMPLIAGTVSIPLATMAGSAAIFIAGYILFGVLMAGTGALTRDAQENTQIASLWMLAAALPFFVLIQISANPSGTLARRLSWFPLTAPVTLLMRMGAGGVGGGELAAAIAMIVLAAIGALALASRLFRRRLLLGGRLFAGRQRGAAGVTS
jgi:ABC-2 type transport system permease protein